MKNPYRKPAREIVEALTDFSINQNVQSHEVDFVEDKIRELVPNADIIQKFYDLTTRLISVSPSGRLEDGAKRAYHDALNALIQARDEARRSGIVEHDESFWGDN